MEDYRIIKYINCHLGFLKCEDCAFNGNCKERFNYQCMANHQSEHLYGTDDKNYHFVLCEKDKFEKLDEKDKAGFISYLTDLYNFLYVHNSVTKTTIWYNTFPVNINKMVDEFAHTEVKGYGIPSMIEVDAYRKGIEDAFRKQRECKFITWSEDDENFMKSALWHISKSVRNGKTKEAGYEWNSVTKELKRINKFKVGDWIVFNGLTLYVKEVVKGFYRTISKDGITNSYDWDIDNIARLWTIQDAKPGDVLVDEDNNIGLYLGKNDDLYWHSRIYLGCDNCLHGFSIGGLHKYKNTKPATKEQCDLLFQKLANAGYVWVTEKKELSKQTLKITPKFCIDQLITDNNGTWYKITNIKCLDDWYYEVYDITEDKTHLELCSNIDESFIFKTIFVR